MDGDIRSNTYDDGSFDVLTWQSLPLPGTAQTLLFFAFFAAFAGDADGIVAEIAHIDGHQLCQAHATVQKQRYNAEISLVKVALYII